MDCRDSLLVRVFLEAPLGKSRRASTSETLRYLVQAFEFSDGRADALRDARAQPGQRGR